jgi:energy-coupling factor transporter ATP-binding protein EcfA2
MIPIDPNFLNSLSEAQREVALTKKGFHFIFQFVFKKGDHLLIFGQTGAGKTQKLYFILNWLRHTRETMIWLDSAKNDEILPLFTMGAPVNIICPKGCDVRITEYDPEQKKYIRMKNHPEVVQVPDAGSVWWAIKKKHINILCLRNGFSSNDARISWMGELFETLSTWTRKKIMPHIYPFALFGDEAQWFNTGLRVSSDQQRKQLSDLITEHALTIRGPGGRLVFATQGYKNLPPAARENFQNNLICRNGQVTSDENPALSKFNPYVPYLKPEEGYFVYSDGNAYPKKRQWTFPFFPMPKLKVEYVGEFDDPRPEAIAEQEIQTEMQPDLSKYQALTQDLQHYEIPHEINRYEIPQGVNTDD